MNFVVRAKRILSREAVSLCEFHLGVLTEFVRISRPIRFGEVKGTADGGAGRIPVLGAMHLNLQQSQLRIIEALRKEGLVGRLPEFFDLRPFPHQDRGA